MNAPDDELPLCWVVARLALDVASPAEPLARLWILKDRIIGVERMLRDLVPRLRCGPMTLDGGPTICICHGCLNSSSVDHGARIRRGDPPGVKVSRIQRPCG